MLFVENMANLMIDTDAMAREREAELIEAEARLYFMQRQSQAKIQAMMIDTDAMIMARDAKLREDYRRTDEMVLASQFEPKNFYKTLEVK